MTSKIAIGELIINSGGETNESVYGINAENIYGDMIIGAGMNIYTEDDDGNQTALLDVVDGKITTTVSGVEDTIMGNVDGMIETVNGSITQVDQKADSINMLIRTFATVTEDGGQQVGTVNSVVTETGYEFGKDGLIISKSDNSIRNKIDNTGMYVQSVTYDDQGVAHTSDVLIANDTGVNAVNLTAGQFLTIGSNSRFEDYMGFSFRNNGQEEPRTGCFFVGTPGSGGDPS